MAPDKHNDSKGHPGTGQGHHKGQGHKKKSIESTKIQEIKNPRTSLHAAKLSAKEPRLVKELKKVDLSMLAKMSKKLTEPTPKLKVPPGRPMGLKNLITSKRVFLHHHKAIADGCAWCCDSNQIYYDILDQYGYCLYRVYEEKIPRCSSKGFELSVKEPDGNSLIKMLKVTDSLRQKCKLAVFCPPNNYVGCVTQEWGLNLPDIHVINDAGDIIIEIRATPNSKAFPSPLKHSITRLEFELQSLGAHTSIGRVGVEWLDLNPGAFASSTVYGISFPKALGCDAKILLLAAWFLIYKLYFAKKMAVAVRHDLSSLEKAMVNFVEATHQSGAIIS